MLNLQKYLCAAIMSALAGASFAQSNRVTYDLSRDWKLGSTRMRTWTLFSGQTSPSFGIFNDPDSFMSGQYMYAMNLRTDESNHLPLFFKSQGLENFVHNWSPGAIVIHPVDVYNGGGNGIATVEWTCPRTANYRLNGGIWKGLNTGTYTNWTVWKGGLPIASGTLGPNEPSSEANPMPVVSEDLLVAKGEKLHFTIRPLGQNEPATYIGTKFIIEGPSASVLLAESDGSPIFDVSPSVLRTNGQVGSPPVGAPRYDIKINAPDLAGKYVRLWIEPNEGTYGHLGHMGLRPTGFLLKGTESVPLGSPSAGGWTKPTRRSFETSTDFKHLVPPSGVLVLPGGYAAPELAQSETIFVQDEESNTPAGSWTVDVVLQGLTFLPESSTIAHIGGRAHHGGDPGTHYGTTSLVSALQELSIPFKRLLGFKLSVNDMSLPFGGMFDNGSWGYGSQDAHFGHRDGNDVDLAVTYMNPKFEKILVGQDRFYIDRSLWASEVSHYHLRVKNPTPRPFILHTKTELLQELPSNVSDYRLTFLNIGGSDASDVSMTVKGRGLTIVSEDLTTPFSLPVDTVTTKVIRVKFGGTNMGTVEVSGTAAGPRSSPIGIVNLTTSPPRVDSHIPIQLARTTAETSITGVSLGPITIQYPEQAAGTVTLNRAPTTPFAVPISISPNDGLLKVDPPTLSVSAGSQSADFKVFTTKAPEVTTVYTLNIGGIVKTLTSKEKIPAISGFSITPANIVGGNESIGTITLDKAATANFQVTVRDNDSRTSVPSTVTVPEGELSTTFAIGSQGTDVQFTSQITVSRAKGVFMRPLVVYPPALDTFSISPTVVKGGTSATGTVTMNGKAPASGVYMNVVSNGPEAVVPSTIGFPQNAKIANFQIGTLTVSARTIRTITVTYAGVTRSKSLTIDK